jgi:hypothetical protein
MIRPHVSAFLTRPENRGRNRSMIFIAEPRDPWHRSEIQCPKPQTNSKFRVSNDNNFQAHEAGTANGRQ